jgi:hypothetical protein
MWETQKKFFQSFMHGAFLFLETSKIRGAIFFGLLPSIHAPSKNRAFLPSPMVTLVAAAKRSKYYGVQGVPRRLQGFALSSHSSQSHLMRRDGEKIVRLRIPKSSTIFRLANYLPSNFAFPSRDLGACFPKESPSYTINIHEDFDRNVEHSDVLDGNAI